MNAHVRDNFNETVTAKVTTAGDLAYATAANALARLGIGTAGQYLMTNVGATAPAWTTPDAVGLKRTTNFGFTDNGPEQAIPFDTELFDTNELHSASANTTRITIQKAGKYLVLANCQYTIAGAHWGALSLKRNGGSYISRTLQFSNGATNLIPSVAGLFAFSQGDYVEAYVQSGNGGGVGCSAQALDTNPIVFFASFISP